MAEEAVVKEPLTPEMVAAGKELVRRLDERHFEVVSALWLYSGEANQWLLILASPAVEAEGPKRAYARVLAILSEKQDETSGLTFENIKLLAPSDSLIRLLRVAVRTGKGISGIRFTRNRINDTFIEDAYIYRVA
ncbi:MAG: hypothetical protein HY237_03935 [Acidobacteria bacterium]|nr:hypothetical protein [Acidobacteriota bacterium]